MKITSRKINLADALAQAGLKKGQFLLRLIAVCFCGGIFLNSKNFLGVIAEF
jgi:hypothetical protein